jgi:predicted negative regulator of RcsB-dependent stress response
VPAPDAFAARYHDVRGDAYLAKKDIPDALTEYQAALAASTATDIDAALLELKIQDLAGAPLNTMNKAKP